MGGRRGDDGVVKTLDERLSDAQLELRDGYRDHLSRAVAEARDRIKELERIVNLHLTGFTSGKEGDGPYEGTYQAWVDRAYAAEAKVDELEREVARLKGYADHKPECRTVFLRADTDAECDCGLDVESRMKGQSCPECGMVGDHKMSCSQSDAKGPRLRMKGLEK